VSRDGTALAVAEAGDPANPTVLCVHGYPDNRAVWDGVVAALADRHHVVAYDVRGAGESAKPRDQAAYHVDRLAEDLAAVADAVSPARPVHVLAHDWGSVQAWHAVTDPALAHRIASFTSISGPSLDHAGHWLRSRLRPNPTALRELVTQLLFSAYIGLFNTPVLPELAWRAGLVPAVLRRVDPTLRPELSDGLHGLKLYRENIFRRFRTPLPRRTDVPVQVLAPTGDPFVGAPMQTDIGRWVSDLRVRRLPGGHWLPRSRPEVIARCTAELVAHVEGGPEPRALRRARVSSTARGRFADQLVVITGAGSGIGRATALAFARGGAELVLTDLDETSVRHTAELAGRLGATAHPSTVDVSDGEAVDRFGKQVIAAHGVPDVVVNNAGIGMAGPFRDTTVSDWERVIDVNLWGVIHGCRAFAGPMADRGEGGRIVNLASAAAYLHSRAISAYSTTKAGVLALSECLRAELAADGVGVIAICPGIVRTNITATTRFVGLDEASERRRQQRTTALYQRRNYPPEKVAAQILDAVDRNRAVVPVTPEARAGLLLSRVTPGALRWAARLDVLPR
jgi:NAD(P)-dependent dehydrogenase (short-subunit alcohol dehydrogenase family)/pimeloyl-ACP methyl ester carboxylesterase